MKTNTLLDDLANDYYRMLKLLHPKYKAEYIKQLIHREHICLYDDDINIKN